jgi:hypothetical protein
MGGCTFTDCNPGKTAKEAFDAAVSDAQYECGHGGYTGTIAEKTSFTEIELPKGREAYEYAEELIDNDDPRVSDKWGPAGCLKYGDDSYLFFGWASE